MADPTPNSTQNQAPKDLIGMLDYYLVQKAPFQIPDAGREWIVKFGPWIAVVLLVISLPALLLVLGLGTAFMPVGYATGFGISAIFLIAMLGLEVAALPGLFARKMTGWKLMFYAQLVGFLHTLVVSSYNIIGGLIGGLIGLTIGLYILFQIRTKYN